MAQVRLPLALLTLSGSILKDGAAQQAGSLREEARLPLPVLRCSTLESCRVEEASLTMDAQWRWLHALDADGRDSYKPCLNGLRWNQEQCPDPASCARRCALEGMSREAYERTGGVTLTNGTVELRFVSLSGFTGSRLYLADAGGHEAYKVLRLKNREFSFEVDVSNLPCGLSGALYLVEMERHGGKSAPGNTAGAQYGTGYCDAGCARSVKFVDGEANLNWRRGACCAQLDLWEANRAASRMSVRPCAANVKGPTACEGEASCQGRAGGGRGTCALEGCSFNPFSTSRGSLYGAGPGYLLDTSRPFTVVTQFLTEGGSDEGELVEVRRLFLQDGRLVGGDGSAQSGEQMLLSRTTCGDDQGSGAGGSGGALKAMGEALERGMVLALSLGFADSSLDSSVGAGSLPAGPCPPRSQEYIALEDPQASVRFANLRYGAVGATAAPRGAGRADGRARGRRPAVGGLRQHEVVEGKFSKTAPVHGSTDQHAGEPQEKSTGQPPTLWKLALLPVGLVACAALASLGWQSDTRVVSFQCEPFRECPTERDDPHVLSPLVRSE